MKDRLKEIRTDKGFRVQQFADTLGVSKSNIESYEYGRRSPSDAFIKLICNRFSVNEEWLRTGEGEKYIPVEDEAAAYIAELLDHDDSPTAQLITKIIKTYIELDEKNRQAIDEFVKQLISNLKGDE